MLGRLGFKGRLPSPLYWLSTKLSPVACVDILPKRARSDPPQYGLIRRTSPGGELVWALVGGAVHRGETLEEALSRHLDETLGPDASWSTPDPDTPQYVAQYFPWTREYHGVDPRKHAIALTYMAEVGGRPEASGEALELRWFVPSQLPPADQVWPGQHTVIMRMLKDA